ncbi:MAG TPA: YdeI/OmpD-associated family protein [Vicinamibacterales bacterium]|nr:YdeI/OmpD-associated family protein [Vicinamibacterales bacterium]
MPARSRSAEGPTPRFFRAAAELRRWLERHHDREPELWVGFYRKDSGRGGLTYSEALDEALCFGWIDGVRKRFDEESYVQRFTPRQAKSYWSAVNTKRVEELKKAGRMHPAGLAAFERRDKGAPARYSFERAAAALGAEHERRFRTDAKAWAYFEAQAPWYRRVAVHWVTSAKRPETRERRLETLIRDSAAGRRISLVRKE